jgi:hypothetical protein
VPPTTRPATSSPTRARPGSRTPPSAVAEARRSPPPWELLAAKGLDTTHPAPPCFDNFNRYVDCGNGTVTDTVTGLIWLKNANCFSIINHSAANQAAAGLAAGQCGLTDGSSAGDERVDDVRADLVLHPGRGGGDEPLYVELVGVDEESNHRHLVVGLVRDVGHDDHARPRHLRIHTRGLGGGPLGEGAGREHGERERSRHSTPGVDSLPAAPGLGLVHRIIVPRVLPSAHTTCVFQRPRRKKAMPTTATTDSAIVMAQNTPSGPSPAVRARPQARGIWNVQ